ncbi:MAG: hypothetical protein KME26_29245 [Oscillatoria princeps RMCB-10]|nr:hypothetical protein [Oscillatoria princeps RMCB-10]
MKFTIFYRLVYHGFFLYPSTFGNDLVLSRGVIINTKIPEKRSVAAMECRWWKLFVPSLFLKT